jgi:hypothetical protein
MQEIARVHRAFLSVWMRDERNICDLHIYQTCHSISSPTCKSWAFTHALSAFRKGCDVQCLSAPSVVSMVSPSIMMLSVCVCCWAKVAVTSVRIENSLPPIKWFFRTLMLLANLRLGGKLCETRCGCR